MSVKSQEHSMRRLAALLGQDLSYIGGDRESGSNGNKKTFLNVGKVFLRALAKDLGLRDVTVSSNPGGIAVEAMDMDQMTNKNVRDAILTMRKEVKKIPGIRYSKYTWNPAYKGVDDYLLSRVAAM